MLLEAARAGRDTYLGIAAATMATAQLLGVAANISFYARDQFAFLGSALAEADWLLQVCGSRVLLVVGFAVIAVGFLGGGDARGPRLRRGALVLAGGFGLMMVGAVLDHFLVSGPFVPEGLHSSTVMLVVAYLSALVAAVLVATAFGGPWSASAMEAAARNRHLGWASVAFGIGYILLLLSGFVTVPVSEDNVTVDVADAVSLAAIAAIAAAVVAAVGFFGAARFYLRPSSSSLSGDEAPAPGRDRYARDKDTRSANSRATNATEDAASCRAAHPRDRGSILRQAPSPLRRREGVLAIAAMLFLLYRALDLVDLRYRASWLWRLELVALVVAALCAAVGFLVSRRSFLGRDDPSFVIGDD